MPSLPNDVFVHPGALCETQDVGPGTRIWAFAHVMKGVRIGRDCNIGDHVFIESGARIGDRVTVKNQVLIWEGVSIESDAFIGPGVVFTNDRYPRSPRMELGPVSTRYSRRENWLVPTLVCRGVSIGAGAIISAGLTLGECCMIGAGAVVTRDVSPQQLVVGNPSRSKGWVCLCGLPLEPAGNSLRSCRCGLRFRENPDGLLERAIAAEGPA